MGKAVQAGQSLHSDRLERRQIAASSPGQKVAVHRG